MGKKIEIFKAGKHRAMSGVTFEFSEADIEATINAYDPALHEAPLVVGHPRMDAPAYGWVKRLAVDNGNLLAEPDQVDQAFAELVAAGRYKHVSAAFYEPGAANNPVPGVYYLRHVGFLGAAPPAVKGLKPVEFAADEEGVVEFGDWSDRTNARLWRRLRDFFIGKFGLEETDGVLPDYEVSDLADESVRTAAIPVEAAAVMPQFTEQHKKEVAGIAPAPQMEGNGMTPEEIAAKENELADREKRLELAERTARHNEHAQFAEGLVKAGKLIPAQSAQAVALLDFAATAGAGVIEFGEGDDKGSLPPVDLVKSFLGNQPKIVEFGEFAKKADDPGAGGAGEKMAALVAAKQKENKDLTYGAAFAEVQEEHPDLASEYLQEIAK